MPGLNWIIQARQALRGRRKIIRINPQDIGFIQYPEFFLQPGRSKRRSLIQPGEWDKIIEGRLYWSSKYEPSASAEQGMLPLTNYVFFESAKAHFLGGKSWGETDWLDWIRTSKVKRYETEQQICERLDFLDGLFDAFLSGDLKELDDDLPLINIGREGRISLDDGRHRLCLAIIAGLREMRVCVNAIHPEAAATTYGSKVIGVHASAKERRLQSVSGLPGGNS